MIIDYRKQMKRNFDHCCEPMQWYLEERKVGIFYNPIFREYYIRLRSYQNGRSTIFYCPWCGKELKPSLIDKYYEVLKSEYNINYEAYNDIYYEIIETPESLYDEEERILPQEFTADEWWKKRGL